MTVLNWSLFKAIHDGIAATKEAENSLHVPPPPPPPQHLTVQTQWFTGIHGWKVIRLWIFFGCMIYCFVFQTSGLYRRFRKEQARRQLEWCYRRRMYQQLFLEQRPRFLPAAKLSWNWMYGWPSVLVYIKDEYEAFIHTCMLLYLAHIITWVDKPMIKPLLGHMTIDMPKDAAGWHFENVDFITLSLDPSNDNDNSSALCESDSDFTMGASGSVPLDPPSYPMACSPSDDQALNNHRLHHASNGSYGNGSSNRRRWRNIGIPVSFRRSTSPRSNGPNNSSSNNNNNNNNGGGGACQKGPQSNSPTLTSTEAKSISKLAKPHGPSSAHQASYNNAHKNDPVVFTAHTRLEKHTPLSQTFKVYPNNAMNYRAASAHSQVQTQRTWRTLPWNGNGPFVKSKNNNKPSTNYNRYAVDNKEGFNICTTNNGRLSNMKPSLSHTRSASHPPSMRVISNQRYVTSEYSTQKITRNDPADHWLTSNAPVQLPAVNNVRYTHNLNQIQNGAADRVLPSYHEDPQPNRFGSIVTDALVDRPINLQHIPKHAATINSISSSGRENGQDANLVFHHSDSNAHVSRYGSMHGVSKSSPTKNIHLSKPLPSASSRASSARYIASSPSSVRKGYINGGSPSPSSNFTFTNNSKFHCPTSCISSSTTSTLEPCTINYDSYSTCPTMPRSDSTATLSSNSSSSTTSLDYYSLYQQQQLIQQQYNNDGHSYQPFPVIQTPKIGQSWYLPRSGTIIHQQQPTYSASLLIRKQHQQQKQHHNSSSACKKPINDIQQQWVYNLYQQYYPPSPPQTPTSVSASSSSKKKRAIHEDSDDDDEYQVEENMSTTTTKTNSVGNNKSHNGNSGGAAYIDSFLSANNHLAQTTTAF